MEAPRFGPLDRAPRPQAHDRQGAAPAIIVSDAELARLMAASRTRQHASVGKLFLIAPIVAVILLVGLMALA